MRNVWEGEKKNVVFLGSTYVFIIRVILSPLRRILPVKNKKKNILEHAQTTGGKGLQNWITQRLSALFLDIDFLSILQNQIHVLIKALPTIKTPEWLRTERGNGYALSLYMPDSQNKYLKTKKYKHSPSSNVQQEIQ